MLFNPRNVVANKHALLFRTLVTHTWPEIKIVRLREPPPQFFWFQTKSLASLVRTRPDFTSRWIW